MRVTSAALAHCAQERIEIPESAQPFGGLVVCDPMSGRIVRHSEQAATLLGRSLPLGEPLLGQVLIELLPGLDGPWQACLKRPPLQPKRINGIQSIPAREGSATNAGLLDLMVHAVPAQNVWVVELFAASDPHVAYEQESTLFAHMSEAIELLRYSASPNDFWAASCDLLQSVLGYDRVMIYRFDADASGQVIAETTGPGVPPKYMNLHFPGSDIPAQARALYERNLLRVIADIDAEPDRLIGPAPAPLDQSMCLLRQSSPLHLQYLRNMGVRATLTVSLLQDGKLWGLLACHHGVPRVPPQHLSRGLLVACSLMGLAFNTHLESLLRIEKLQNQQRLAEGLVTLAEALSKTTELSDWWPQVERFVRQHLPLERFEVLPRQESPASSAGRGLRLSDNPPTADISLMAGQPLEALLLSLVKAAQPVDAVWAGDPTEHEPMALNDGSVVLGPRQSFQAWRENTAPYPTPWSDHERAVLGSLEALLHEAQQTRLLRAQDARLRILGAALEQSREMVIVSNAEKDPATGERSMIFVNEALLAGTQYTRDELIGRSPSMFQGPQTDRAAVARISQQLGAGQPAAETLLNHKKDGSTHWLDLRIHPLIDALGKISHFVSVQRDVTQERESLAQLQHQNAFLTRLTDLLPGAVFVYRRTPQGTYFFDFTTAVFQTLLGVHTQPPDQHEVLSAIHPGDRSSVVDGIERSALTRSRWRQRFRAQALPGAAQRTLEGIADPMVEADGTVVWFGIILDVTEQVEVELALNEALIEHQATLEAVPEQLIELKEDGTIVRAHVRDNHLLGLPLDDLLDRRIADVWPQEIGRTFARAIAEAGRGGVSSAHEIAFAFAGQLQHRSLTVVRKHRNAQPDTEGSGALLIASLSDITERKLAEERVQQLVNHDELTQLFNRRGFQERLQLIHDHARRRNTAYALMFIDLDHFKHLNDSMGHDAGDMALEQTAARLSAHTRSSDVVARLGGDEFVVLIAGTHTDSLGQEALQLATKLGAALAQPLSLSGQPFNLTCSIGIALSEAANPHSHDVLRWADLAMYSVKESGRNGVRFFDERIQQRMLYRVQLEQDLRAAVASEALSLHGQPIVDELARTQGFEVLLRWTRVDSGPVSPADFIPVAEQSGLIVPLGQWVLQQACQMLAAWATQDDRSQLFVAVNVSAIQIKQSDFVERVSQTLERTGAPPHRLKLELTESLLHEDVDATIEKLHQLRALGVQLSLDDFGTGYSSLAYLRKLPIQELKIDRSFVLHALEQPDDAAVARLIVQLAQTLRLEVVAEGVETAEQLAFLHAIGCRRFQGYMFGRPQPMG